MLFRPRLYAVRGQYGRVETFGDLVTDGQDQSRNTAGSFTAQYGYVTFLQYMKITSLLWDIRNTGTYALSINGVNLATVTISSAPAADRELTLSSPLFVAPGRYVVTLTRTGASTWSDKNGSTYSSAYWSTVGIYYDGTYYSGYSLPIKIKGYVWTRTWHPVGA